MGPEKMRTIEQMLEEIAAQPDTGAALSSEQISQWEVQLARTAFHGLALAGPAHTRPDRAAETPLLLLQKFTTLREWQVRPRLNTQVIVFDPVSATLQARNFFYGAKERIASLEQRSQQGPRPGEHEWNNSNTVVRPFDLSRLFGSVPPASRVRVSVVCFDLLSNTVSMPLGPQDAGLAVPAAIRTASLILPETARFGADVPVQAMLQLAGLAAPGTRVSAALLVLRLDQAAAQVARLEGVAGDSPSDQVSLTLNLRTAVALAEGSYCIYLFAGEQMAGPIALTVGRAHPPTAADSAAPSVRR